MQIRLWSGAYPGRMETGGDKIPMLAFTEDNVPIEHAFDVYHDTTAPLFDTNVCNGVEEFRSNAVDYLVDDVVVSRVQAGPHTLRRTPTHLRDGTTEWITVQLHYQGGLTGTAGDNSSVDFNADRIGIVDLETPFNAWNRGGAALWVGIPRQRLAQAEPGVPVRTLDRWGPRGRVLVAAMDRLWRQVGDACAEDAPLLASAIAETLDTVLRQADFTPTGRDLTEAMTDHVKSNLGDLELGLDDLRRTFHCSRSSVYRAFEPHGGVGAYIRDQRLLRCFDELACPTSRPRRVSDVATRWGFANPSHFHRLFTAKFGLVPSELAADHDGRERSTEVPPAAAEQILDFHAWAGSA